MSRPVFFLAPRCPPVLLACVLVLGGCASGGEAMRPSGNAAVQRAGASLADDGAAQLNAAKEAHARRHLVRGLTQTLIGDTSAARVHYEQALDAAPEAPALLSALAEAQAATGALAEALYHAEQARRLAPGERFYHRQVARLHRRAGRLDEAAAAYETLLERFPDARGDRLALARLRRAQERPRDAIALLEETLRHHPTDASAAVLLSATYRAEGRRTAADTLEARFALASFPPAGNAAPTSSAPAETASSAEALARRGQSRYEAGAFAEAAALLARALEADPRAPARWARAADAFRRAGDPARAAAAADEGLLLFPGQLALLRAHAAALEADGQSAAAARRYEEALRIMRDDGLTEARADQAARFHEALARLYALQERVERAARHRDAAQTLRRAAE